MIRSPKYAALSLLVALGFSATAHSQVPKDEATQRLPVLSRSVAGTDDSTALATNPANIGFMPAAELRWSAIFLDDELFVPWQGHAFSFATPLPLNLSTGLRVDLVNPPDTSISPGNYQYVTWGLALSDSERFSLGFSLQRAYSDSS